MWEDALLGSLKLLSRTAEPLPVVPGTETVFKTKLEMDWGCNSIGSMLAEHTDVCLYWPCRGRCKRSRHNCPTRG